MFWLRPGSDNVNDCIVLLVLLSHCNQHQEPNHSDGAGIPDDSWWNTYCIAPFAVTATKENITLSWRWHVTGPLTLLHGFSIQRPNLPTRWIENHPWSREMKPRRDAAGERDSKPQPHPSSSHGDTRVFKPSHGNSAHFRTQHNSWVLFRGAQVESSAHELSALMIRNSP